MGWDRIPIGKVEIRRDSIVSSIDSNEIGHVDGFVCDQEGHVTHLVLKEGHVLGQRDVVIPIGQVERLQNGHVKVALTSEQIADLPGVSVHRWHRPRAQS